MDVCNENEHTYLPKYSLLIKKVPEVHYFFTLLKQSFNCNGFISSFLSYVRNFVRCQIIHLLARLVR